MTLRSRPESFGAWVRLDDTTMVALDREAAKKLGVDGGALWRGPPPTDATGPPIAPLELHVAVTSRCGQSCEGCYLDARADGAHVPLDALTATLEAAAKAGVFTIAFGGGEPLTRPDLGELAAIARRNGLVPVVTTSGVGLSRERARTLRSFAQVNVSLEPRGGLRAPSTHTAAEQAIAALVAEGVPAGVNVVVSRHAFDALEETCLRAATLGAKEVQLLRWKPAGDRTHYLAHRLDPGQVDELPSKLRSLVSVLSGRAAVRIDCALVPLLSPALDADDVARLGVLGCEAASALAATTVDGRVSPCSFLPATDHGAGTLGALGSVPSLLGLHAFARELPPPCATCPLARTCRGGCRAVSACVVGDPLAPDPECPGVRR